jgi:cell division septal protein FtsQ
MDTKDANTAWIVAGILAVLLVITLYFLISANSRLSNVLANGSDQITAERDQIAQDCGTAGDKAACNQDLSDLASILKDFSASVSAATTSSAQ